jgi:hypothetical protein
LTNFGKDYKFNIRSTLKSINFKKHNSLFTYTFTSYFTGLIGRRVIWAYIPLLYVFIVLYKRAFIIKCLFNERFKVFRQRVTYCSRGARSVQLLIFEPYQVFQLVRLPKIQITFYKNQLDLLQRTSVKGVAIWLIFLGTKSQNSRRV